MAKKKTKTPAGKTTKVVKVERKRIRVDAEIQSRVRLDDDLIAEYAGEMAAGCKFPPVDLFFDGQIFWLADGFHRIAAAFQNGPNKAVSATVHKGGKREAVLFAIKANIGHGLRRTNADKRRAVERILADEKWVEWSDKYIARMCGVGFSLVAEVRESIYPNRIDAHPKKKDDGPVREVVRKGKTYTMKVGEIGRSTSLTTGKGGKPRASRGHLKPFTDVIANPSKHSPRMAMELHHDPELAANTLMSCFEIPYLEKLIAVLTERIEQEKERNMT